MRKPIPSVSVVIPVKNEVSNIKACLDGILSQSILVREIIVIDSGSTDGTLDILNQYPLVKLIEIPSNEFNHGETRNLGVREATGDFVLLTVGDARPVNDKWIEELLNGFLDDEVVGVCGQQLVPHDKDKNPVDWYAFYSKPKIFRYQLNKDEFEHLPPSKKREICRFDDVNAMYRRKALIELPFRKTSYSEDVIWARDAIISGYAIVYTYKSRVFHYHREDSDFTLKRKFTTLYFSYRYFGYKPEIQSLTIFEKLRLIYIIIKRIGLRKDIFKWYSYNVSNRQAAIKAIALFLDKTNEGDSVLDSFHNQFCGKPPIPKKY